MSEDDQAAEQQESTAETGSRWRELYKTEDYWAIWLGLAIIAFGLLVFLPRPPEGMNETIAWEIGDDINYYTEIKDGSISGQEGKPASPTISVGIENVGDALKLLTGKMVVEESMDKLKVSGDASKTQQLLFILEAVKDNMGDLI